MASEDERRERAIRTIKGETGLHVGRSVATPFHAKPVADDEVRREMDDDEE